jgi:hypothetical protein
VECLSCFVNRAAIELNRCQLNTNCRVIAIGAGEPADNASSTEDMAPGRLNTVFAASFGIRKTEVLDFGKNPDGVAEIENAAVLYVIGVRGC